MAGLELLEEYAQATNIAEDLDEQRLLDIGRRVCEDFDSDYGSLDEWRKRNEQAIELAKQVSEEKSYPWPGAANVKYPLVTSAAIHFNARCYPAIVAGNEVVKGKIVGEDPQGLKSERAERVGEHMSYQLLEEMEEWEEETDKLTTILPIVGNVFRKTYFCPIRKRNKSKLVRAENFVFGYEYAFDDAPRHTEIMPNIYPQQIIERQRMGLWLGGVDKEGEEVADPLDYLGLTGEHDDDTPQEFLEQHCLIDLDDDGYKEPYIVTVHHESQKVVRITARYDVEEVTVKYAGEVGKVKDFEAKVKQAQAERFNLMNQYEVVVTQAMQQGLMPPQPPVMGPLPTFDRAESSIVCIEPVKYYTKYGFIPSFDGGGYDVGLGQLLGPLGNTINTNLNQLIDAGTLQNMQGGLISKGLKIRKGKTRLAMNEWHTVDNSSGGSIRDAFAPFPNKGPSVVLLNLVTFLIEAAKDISSVKDAVTGESGGANESPTTYLARIDEGLKVFSAIYKRIHRSLKQEYKKLYRLNRLYMPDVDYYTILDTPQAIKRQDYEDDGVDVIPVSDPSVATTVQKNAKANAVYQIGKGNPMYDQHEVEKRFLSAMGIPHEGLLLKEPPQPPPDPRMVEINAKVEKMGAETERTRAETAKAYNDIQAKMIELQQNSEKTMMEFQKSIKEIDLKRIGQVMDYFSKVVTEQENYDIHRRMTDGSNAGRVPNMEGPPNNNQGLSIAGDIPE